ncbi:MAG: UDP-N-acetylmuramoyl-tripeptide--D-alanyl-D-alanine ligase [Crocinitomicaceae bacterium]|nr:UDP-N-acetylmuramoyl-tripeptide--D-alanyl-D-alanine ligase [Crocinitomicaceae bacterium]
MRKRILDHFLSHRSITTDTRKVTSGSMFFALKGANFNGNRFASEALAAGCSMVIVDEETGMSDQRLIKVNNVLNSLQHLALDYRRTFHIPFLAITGSNGKTTTKELVRDVLAKKFKVHATAGNLNNHIGIPLTILSMPPDTTFAVIEMGANHQGEIASYCTFTEPDFGIVTNIGKAHLQGFGGIEGVKKGKKELYDFLYKNGGTLFANTEMDTIREITNGMQIVPFGFHSGGIEVTVTREEPTLAFSLKTKNFSQSEITTHFAGTFNLYNIVSAIAVGIYFDVEAEEIISAITDYTPENNRSQLIHTAYNTLIMDAYNANPTSMEHALIHLSRQSAKNKFFVIGDMLELGKEGPEEHRKILIKAAELHLHGISVGQTFKSLEREFPFLSFASNSEAVSYLKEKKLKDHLILIKGSRGIAVEVVKEAL